VAPASDDSAPPPPVAERGAQWEEFLDWLTEMQRVLPLYGKTEDREICARLIAVLRQRQEEDAALAGLREWGPAVRQCLGGTRNFFRAIAAGHVDLTPELRAELIDMVREISEIVMAHDLEERGDS
jgi:hypothetical protein